MAEHLDYDSQQRTDAYQQRSQQAKTEKNLRQAMSNIAVSNKMFKPPCTNTHDTRRLLIKKNEKQSSHKKKRYDHLAQNMTQMRKGSIELFFSLPQNIINLDTYYPAWLNDHLKTFFERPGRVVLLE